MKVNYLLISAGVSSLLGLHSIFPSSAAAAPETANTRLLLVVSSEKDLTSPSLEIPSAGASPSLEIPSAGASPSLEIPSAGSVISPAAANQQLTEQARVEQERSSQQAAEQARIQEEQRRQADVAQRARIQEEQRRQADAAEEQARIQEEQRRQTDAAEQVNRQQEVRVASSSELSTVNSAPRSEPKVERLTKKVDVKQVIFRCEDTNGVPTTIAKLKDDKKSFIISWKSDFFNASGYNSQTRCKQASSRFEIYRKSNKFVYLTTGKINSQPTICLTGKENGVCGEGIQSQQGLLFTLKPNSSPQEILEKLTIALQSHEIVNKPALEE